MHGEIRVVDCAPIDRRLPPRKLRYFVAANLWLAFTILLVVGSTVIQLPGEDAFRSFLGVGKTPVLIYLAIVVFTAVIAGLNFVLYLGGRSHGPERISMPAE